MTDELVQIILQPGRDPGAADVFLDFISYSDGPLPEELLPMVKVSGEATSATVWPPLCFVGIFANTTSVTFHSDVLSFISSVRFWSLGETRTHGSLLSWERSMQILIQWKISLPFPMLATAHRFFPDFCCHGY